MTAREKILQIAQRLEKHFGKLPWRSHGDPLDVLILTILSQNTNDQNRDRAYESLKRRFPTYESIVRAPTEKVAEAIKVGGLHRQKARRIQEILRRLKRERGAYDLSYLKDLSTEEAVHELLKFHLQPQQALLPRGYAHSQNRAKTWACEEEPRPARRDERTRSGEFAISIALAPDLARAADVHGAQAPLRSVCDRRFVPISQIPSGAQPTQDVLKILGQRRLNAHSLVRRGMEKLYDRGVQEHS
jgi:hypothetical protein